MDSSRNAILGDGVPAPATVGLALAVVRSKPPQTTIDEHVDHILRCIKSNCGPAGQASCLKVDATASWRTQFDQAERDKARLEDEITKLRDELRHLKQSGRATKKRRPEIDTTTKANTQSKRRRLADFSDDGGSDADFVNDHGLVDPEISGLLGSLLRLQQLTTSDTASTSEVHIGISRLCNAVSNMAKREIELVARIKPVYLCVIKAMRYIHDSAPSDSLILSSNLGSLVKLFQTLLGSLHQIALDEVARKEYEELRRSKKPKSNSKIAKASGPEDEQRCHARLAALTQLMASLFATIDISIEADNELYETLTIALFDHIGSSVSLLVFIDPQLSDAGLVPVRGPLDVAHVESESAVATAQLSAPYLVKLLRAALQATRKSRPQHNGDTLDQGKPGVPVESHRDTLLRRVEERLQHTLLRGIFGDDDGSFKHAFARRDETDDSDAPTGEEPEELEQDLSSIFIGQVWELLGWDILSGHMARS